MGKYLARSAGGLAIVLSVAAMAAGDEPAAVKVAAASETTAVSIDAKPAVAATLRHGVFRFTSYPAAWTAAQKTNRPILVFATAPGCPHCVKMLGETYRAPNVARLVNESFETVYVDRLEQPELAAKLKVKWFPTTIVVGPNNKVIDVIEGYVDSKTLAQRLQTTVVAESAVTQRR